MPKRLYKKSQDVFLKQKSQTSERRGAPQSGQTILVLSSNMKLSLVASELGSNPTIYLTASELYSNEKDCTWCT